MSKAIDITGKKFGLWTVISRNGTASNRATMWLCKCECGTEKTISNLVLRGGESYSCGCAVSPNRINRHIESRTHGKTKSPEYQAWRNMKNRCLRPDHPDYPQWGGRGITICDRWMNFENFYADMGDKPSAKHSLDRINNNAGYDPSNCRWATWQQQNANRRESITPVSLVQVQRKFQQ